MMRFRPVSLVIVARGMASVDQVLWSAWGFCMVESCFGGELWLDAQELYPGLAARIEQFEAAGNVTLRINCAGQREHSKRFAAVSSAATVSPALLQFARCVFVSPQDPLTMLPAECFWNHRWMQRFRQRAQALSESILDVHEQEQLTDCLRLIQPSISSVSLLSSIFRADRFLVHFLGNCAELAGYRKMEHWLIRAGSPGDEHATLLAHTRRWPGAVYLNLEKDPGLYETWNLGCCLARGRFLSSANVDDRRHPQQVQRLSAALVAHPAADLASAALRVTDVENQDWDDWSNGRVFYSEDTDGEYGGSELVRKVGGQLRPRNIPHCMPLWRRSLHGLRGFFNEPQYGPSADWEYWLRCADAGSRYYHTSEALGLYLKREDSYWHRDPTARRFDELILARYGPLVTGESADPALHGLSWRDLTRFQEAGNWLGVLLSLVRLNALPGCIGTDAAVPGNVVAAYAQRYFGLAEFTPVDAGWLHGGTNAVLERLQPVLVDWLQAFLEQENSDGADTDRAADCWRALLVDWHLVTGDAAPLIGLALMQRRLAGDSEAEQVMLRAIHTQDPQGFWRGVQRVYRFAVPLEDLVSTVDALALSPTQSPAPGPVRLVYFPSYSNKYQELLYWSCQRAGIQVEPAADIVELEALAPQPDCANIVHLHWLNAAFADPSMPFEQAAEHFLATVRSLKARGFTLYWTVHNRFNHDSEHRQAEARLRAELAALVDRVYLHHPVLAPQLDWLPKEVRPWSCEHGPYVNPYTGGINRTLARQRLGLDTQERVLLWFGQIRPYKGLEDWLPQILQRLAEHGRSRLLVAGRIASPDVQALLQRYPDQTLFINRFVPNTELQHLACAADFGLLTYRDILTSGAMFHLYGMGLPVIAPDMGSLPAYVVPGWNGFLYRDARELDETIIRVHGMKDQELARFRQAAELTGNSVRWGKVV
jgi:glycosyltransferase involved in cell wall biosynthesis